MDMSAPYENLYQSLVSESQKLQVCKGSRLSEGLVHKANVAKVCLTLFTYSDTPTALPCQTRSLAERCSTGKPHLIPMEFDYWGVVGDNSSVRIH